MLFVVKHFLLLDHLRTKLNKQIAKSILILTSSKFYFSLAEELCKFRKKYFVLFLYKISAIVLTFVGISQFLKLMNNSIRNTALPNKKLLSLIR